LLAANISANLHMKKNKPLGPSDKIKRMTILFQILNKISKTYPNENELHSVVRASRAAMAHKKKPKGYLG
jgi:hypothetical protein